jgi:seryl-tRNA synthetase
MTFRISKDVRHQMDEARDQLVEVAKTLEALGISLSDAAESLRDEWNEKTERWQGSERGEAVEAWIAEIESLAAEVEELGNEASTREDQLGEITDKPEV